MTSRTTVKNPRIDELLRAGRVKSALQEPLRKNEESADRLEGWFGVDGRHDAPIEAAAYSALTLGDLVYDYSRIDPGVVAGIDFASTEDLDDLFSFSTFARQQLERGEESLDGVVSRLQGYVAEGVVASNLQARGHDVTPPDSSNQEGWDLLVDGEPFQVKCVESARTVTEHLEANPDIPVIVNRELVEELGDVPGVYVDFELSRELVREATEQSLESGAELLDFEIPWISLTVASAFGIRDLIYGRSDLPGVVTNVLTDTTGRIVCGTLGEWAGAAVGLALFGPAGGIIGPGFGAIAGAGLAGKPLARAARTLLTRSEEAELEDSIRELAREANAAMDTKEDAWTLKKSRVAEAFRGGSANRALVGDFVLSKMDEDIAYFANKRDEIQRLESREPLDKDPVESGKRLLTGIQRAGIHTHKIQDGLGLFFERLDTLAAKRRKLKLV